VLIFIVIKKLDVRPSTTKHFQMLPTADRYKSLLDAIASKASQDRYIVLSMVDEAFVDMAFNLYEASLRPHRINNYLFVGVGNFTCQILASQSLACFHYVNDPSEQRPSTYGSKDFKRKMNIRTDMILEAISGNYTVLHTDLDVYFISSPIDEIKVRRNF